MKRLIERSRSVGEVLRWVTQNPSKVSASHYPIALHKLGQLLQQQQGQATVNGESRGPSQMLEQPEFQTLCQAIISGCSKFDNFSIVNCLYAAAALGLPGESPLVRVLEDESRSRLGRFNQKDVSMVFSSEANNKALEAIFSSQLFYENRQERFIRSMAEWLPRKAENLTPYTMALIAKYVARHRLREPRLLDTIANFLLKRGEQLDSKVIQKLVFPFSRMNYRPSNHSELFPKLEAILEQKAGSSPLATVNILMSMFQLSHFPQTVLHQVFSPAFITNVMSIPKLKAILISCSQGLRVSVQMCSEGACGSAVLEGAGWRFSLVRPLTLLFPFSYKGLVAEALRQLVGEECYRQDEVLPPGYCTDFLLWINRSGTVLPLSRVPAASKAPSAHATMSPAAISLRSSVLALTSDLQDFAPFAPETPSSPSGSRENNLAGRVVLSVNDKWHYCQNSDILVGSRAMRDRHLRLLGYCLVQV
ncbi:FASTK kinase, partial [Scopus umbretta]|nr:FASTK kinase [Scopus umbretta]